MAFHLLSLVDSRGARLAAAVFGVAVLASCHTAPRQPVAPPLAGDEIVVAGQRFHTGTRVITWTEPDGYSAYRGAPPLIPRQAAASLSPKEIAWVKDRGWDVPTLQKVVDQFVLHYDACGLSKICFNTLHARGLNVHFLLDVDGTVYQTLDLQERALHATTSNDRSIGIEIANIGAYPPAETKPLDDWYQRDAQGRTSLKVPVRVAAPGIHTKDFTGQPARPAPVRGALQGRELVQYDFTPQQYAALVKLTTALCRVFPRITCDFPHDNSGRLITRKLPDDELAKYHGILGHYHIQENKIDPGPALQWRRLIDDVRKAP
jgi:N-acetylmuramoyl-L-alanine amidase